MSRAIKRLAKIPVTHHRFLSRDGAGDITYAPPVDLLCYPVDKTEVVKNNAGTEIVSKRQLYFEGSVDINETDSLVFEGKKYPVKALSVYRNSKCVKALLVVYL